jgi:hypothetical protein
MKAQAQGAVRALSKIRCLKPSEPTSVPIFFLFLIHSTLTRFVYGGVSSCPNVFFLVSPPWSPASNFRLRIARGSYKTEVILVRCSKDLGP